MKAMEMIAYYVLGIPDLIDDICDKFDCVDLDTEYLKDIIEECSYRNLKKCWEYCYQEFVHTNY